KETVLSQIARAVVGNGTIGNIAFFVIQAMTVLILVLAANTSFADFPRLASFHAHDHFLPSPLTKRGRRLVSGDGRKWSWAWKLASRGKSANDVFAASTRMSTVIAWITKKAMLPIVPLPTTARAIWLSTVSL